MLARSTSFLKRFLTRKLHEEYVFSASARAHKLLIKVNQGQVTASCPFFKLLSFS